MDAVKTKNTTELLRDLKKSAHFSDFVRKNEKSLRHDDFTRSFTRLFEQQGRSKAEIARAAGTSEAYLYQIISGHRTPSRNRLLCICIGIHTPVDEAQALLKQCGHAPLSAREKRDAAILYGLIHGLTLNEVNDSLFECGELSLME